MMGNITIFKICPGCNTIWETRQDFLDDPDVKITGYQANFEFLKEGLFFFNHLHCRSTIAVRTGLFHDLYQGPIFRERKTGEDDCPRYCLRKTEMRACPAKCECAYVREILVIIKTWPHPICTK